MSHFSVLCITTAHPSEELQQLLDPYNEDDHRTEVVHYEGEEDYYRNPNAKWDWWTVGGRWSNALMRLDGSMADSVMRGDLAVDAMRSMAAATATAYFDDLEKAADGTPVATLWEELIAGVEPGTLSPEARETWRAQPRVQALRQMAADRGDPIAWNLASDLVDLQVLGREHYIERARLQAIPGYATLTAEGWHAKGEMGWFGTSSDTDDSTMQYLRGVNRLIDGLPPTAWLTIVDCHI